MKSETKHALRVMAVEQDLTMGELQEGMVKYFNRMSPLDRRNVFEVLNKITPKK